MPKLFISGNHTLLIKSDTLPMEFYKNTNLHGIVILFFHLLRFLGKKESYQSLLKKERCLMECVAA